MIGIFDSGIGGLTVVRAVMDRLPGYDIVYFGDTARTPYGNKSSRTVVDYSLQNIRFLLDQGAKLVVMACNTASSVATDTALSRFNMPIYEVITPAVNQSLEISKKMAIGVIGTRATITSGIYEKKIHEKAPEARIYSTPCPLLVPLVEEGWLNKPETRMIVKKYLHPLKVRQIDALILGCTHYPLLKPIIAHKIGKKVAIIDSSMALAEEIKAFLAENPQVDRELSKNGKADFFVSDITPQFEKTARAVIKRNITLKHVGL
ncbi:MAG: glutamate racemase [Desulfobacterales bacterium]|nr:glutamate racemase [Desulfobacterales bacterium]